jgi:hypothetical protein
MLVNARLALASLDLGDGGYFKVTLKKFQWK